MGPRTRMRHEREERRLSSSRQKTTKGRHDSNPPVSQQGQGHDSVSTSSSGVGTASAPGRENIVGFTAAAHSSRGRGRGWQVTLLTDSGPLPAGEPTLLVIPSQEEVVLQSLHQPPAQEPQPLSQVLQRVPRQASRQTRRQEQTHIEVASRNLRSVSSQIPVRAGSSSSLGASATGGREQGKVPTTARRTLQGHSTSVGLEKSSSTVNTSPKTRFRNAQAPTMRMSTGRSASVRSQANTQTPSTSGPETRSRVGQSCRAAAQNLSSTLGSLKGTGKRKRHEPATNTGMLLRAAAKKLPVACRYAASGCKEIMVAAELEKHTVVCDFRPYDCPLQLEDCHWRGELDEIINHLCDDHSDIDQQKGPIIEIIVTNITQPAPMRWFVVQTCLGKHFLIIVEKIARNRLPQFFGTAKILGSQEEAKGFECEMVVKHPKKKLSYCTIVRTLRSGHEVDCLSLDERSADLFAEDNNLLIEVGISMHE